MDKYHDEQLYDILGAQAKWELDEDIETYGPILIRNPTRLPVESILSSVR
jgi:hypothetical protein